MTDGISAGGCSPTGSDGPASRFSHGSAHRPCGCGPSCGASHGTGRRSRCCIPRRRARCTRSCSRSRRTSRLAHAWPGACPALPPPTPTALPPFPSQRRELWADVNRTLIHLSFCWVQRTILLPAAQARGFQLRGDFALRDGVLGLDLLLEVRGLAQVMGTRWFR